MKRFLGKALNQRLLWREHKARGAASPRGFQRLQGGSAAARWGAEGCEVPPYLVELYPLLGDAGLGVLQAEDPELGLHQVGGVLLHRRDVKPDDPEVKAVVVRRDGVCNKADWDFITFPDDEVCCSFKHPNTRQPQSRKYLKHGSAANGQFSTINNLIEIKKIYPTCFL